MKDSNDEAYQALALAAHELRSPASALAGYLRLLQKGAGGPLSEGQQKLLQDTTRSCDRILHLVRELSDFAALTRGAAPETPRSVEIFALCEEVLRGMLEQGAGDFRFDCPAGDRTALVNGNVDRLRRALSAIVVSVRREQGPGTLDTRGHIDRQTTPAQAVIVIGDKDATEIVMGAERPVYEFDRWRGGMGMALPIACNIIEAYGGRVWSPANAPQGAAAVGLPLAHLP